MKTPAFLFFLYFLWVSPVPLFSQEKSSPAIGKEPAWIGDFDPNYRNTSLNSEADDGYIDLLFEKQVNLQHESVYFRKAFKILSESGVQNRSEISVNFDPSYNKLIFHSIRIIRGKQSINKLQPGHFKIIQQENELNRYLYNGSLSAVMFLEDVRKGDIIEYSYSIEGFNPVFAGKYDDILETQFSVPVYNMHYRIVVPPERSLQIKNWLIQPNCNRYKIGKDSIYDWTFRNVAALHVQDGLPSWYDPYSMIQVSEFRDWKEVSRWAASLFPQDDHLSPGLKSKLAQIKKNYTSKAKQFLAALRFVQDDVRYMGIEMGENSHRPNSPVKIFEQRFGDCKDKSYLLVTMARMLGIGAQPVLINTDYKQSLHNWLPSANAFDHVVVRVMLNDKYYWFDPTIAYQRGGLDDIDFPDYACGLLVSDTTHGLTDIPLQQGGLVDVKEIFTIPDISGKAKLMIKTEYSGSFADNMREDLHNNSLYEIRQNFQEFYSNYYDHITIDSLSWSDNESSGKLTTMEHYSIDQIWETEDGVKKLFFTSCVINGVLKKPRETKRKMPFYVTHPAHYREEVIVNLPDDWRAEESSANISCDAFQLKSKCSYANRKLDLRYEYKSLKDHVMPSEADDFFASYQKANDNIHYELLYNDVVKTQNKPGTHLQIVESPSPSVNRFWLLPFFTLLLAGIFFWWGRRK